MLSRAPVDRILLQVPTGSLRWQGAARWAERCIQGSSGRRVHFALISAIFPGKKSVFACGGGHIAQRAARPRRRPLKGQLSQQELLAGMKAEIQFLSNRLVRSNNSPRALGGRRIGLKTRICTVPATVGSQEPASSTYVCREAAIAGNIDAVRSNSRAGALSARQNPHCRSLICPGRFRDEEGIKIDVFM